MVTGMKQFARGFQDQFKKDEVAISEVGKVQSLNIEKTDAEVEKINYQQKHVVTGFMQRIIMLIFAIATFVFMIFFIRMFPSKVYH